MRGALLAMLAGACWVGEPAHVPPRQLAGTVLVWLDAQLFLSLDGGAPYVQVAALRGPRAAALGYAAPMRVAGDDGGAFVEVEPARADDCVWARFVAPPDVDRVRVLVRRTDLAPVLARPFARDFDDRTRVALAPGVAVAPAPGGYAVELGGGTVVLPIPDADVGFAYEPAPTTEDDERGDIAIHGVDAQLGGRTLHLRDRFVANRAVPGGERTLFPISEPCRVATVAIASADIRAAVREQIGQLYGVGELGGTSYGVDYIPKGAALRSRGRAVARARRAFELDPDAREPCIGLVWTIETDETPHPQLVRTDEIHRTMHLCADPRDVVHNRMP